jgi:hypothetical protein
LGNGWAGITIGDAYDYVGIWAGSDNDGSYYYYEAVIDGNAVSEKAVRSVDDGTLYVSYDADTNEIYLSSTGYGSENAYSWSTVPGPLQCQWTGDVTVSVGGGSGVALEQGDAYLDNLIVDSALLLGWPPVTDMHRDGYIDYLDLAVVADSWLMTGVGVEGGDINGNGQGDGIVNLIDFGELGLAW